MTLEELQRTIVSVGERLPKKHGDWYRVHVYDNHYLILDTWNKHIYHYSNGAIPSDTDNLYRVVYVFYDNNGDVNNYSIVKKHMCDFWYGHICSLSRNK